MIAVTGATGFLGHHLVPLLIQRGHVVRALVRATSDVRFLKDCGVELIDGDIRRPESIERLVDGCDAVIHAAGRFRFWGKREDFRSVNVEGTRNILEAARCANVQRFVHISTVAVIGAPRPNTIIDENTPCQPCDEYQHSKLAGERLALKYHADFGLPVIVLRPGAFYGPGSRYAWNRLFFEDPHRRRLRIQINGGRYYTFPVFVPDLAQVIEAALGRGTPGRLYNISGPSLTHREVNTIISRLIGDNSHFINVPKWTMLLLARWMTFAARFTHREPFYPIGLASYVFNDWIVDSRLAKRDLDFNPTPFEDGARVTIEWYRTIGLLPSSKLKSRSRRLP
jgi:dihydroflavonol-4-reductase